MVAKGAGWGGWGKQLDPFMFVRSWKKKGGGKKGTVWSRRRKGFLNRGNKKEGGGRGRVGEKTGSGRG